MGFGLPAAMGASLGCPGRPVVGHLGRRQHPDEHPGAGHLQPEQDSGQDRRPQQFLPRHGPPVAGALLQRQLFQDLSQGKAGMPRRPARATGRTARTRSGPISSGWPRPTACPGSARRAAVRGRRRARARIRDGRARPDGIPASRRSRTCFPMVPGGKPINHILLGGGRLHDGKTHADDHRGQPGRRPGQDHGPALVARLQHRKHHRLAHRGPGHLPDPPGDPRARTNRSSRSRSRSRSSSTRSRSSTSPTTRTTSIYEFALIKVQARKNRTEILDLVRRVRRQGRGRHEDARHHRPVRAHSARSTGSSS